MDVVHLHPTPHFIAKHLGFQPRIPSQLRWTVMANAHSFFNDNTNTIYYYFIGQLYNKRQHLLYYHKVCANSHIYIDKHWAYVHT